MTGRPCKPDADLKGLWRMLLGTSFPACGIAEDSDSADRDGAAFERNENQSAEAAANTAISRTWGLKTWGLKTWLKKDVA